MQPDFARNGERSETVDEGKVISKMTRSRERMRDGYFSNISALVLFVFRQMLQHREIPFSRRPSFAFRFCFSYRSMLLQLSPRLLFTPSLPLTVGEFFIVHLFRRIA